MDKKIFAPGRIWTSDLQNASQRRYPLDHSCYIKSSLQCIHKPIFSNLKLIFWPWIEGRERNVCAMMIKKSSISLFNRVKNPDHQLDMFPCELFLRFAQFLFLRKIQFFEKPSKNRVFQHFISLKKCIFSLKDALAFLKANFLTSDGQNSNIQ